jgi:hypothetical protein
MAEKRRKPATKMTGDEIAQHVFPPELHRQLKQAANPDDASQPRKPKSPKSP